jgi:hypothetical protein
MSEQELSQKVCVVESVDQGTDDAAGLSHFVSSRRKTILVVYSTQPSIMSARH